MRVDPKLRDAYLVARRPAHPTTLATLAIMPARHAGRHGQVLEGLRKCSKTCTGSSRKWCSMAWCRRYSRSAIPGSGIRCPAGRSPRASPGSSRRISTRCWCSATTAQRLSTTSTACMRPLIDKALDRYGTGCSAVFVSGGGNDFAGFNDLRPLLGVDCSACTTEEACFNHGTGPGTVEGLFDRVKHATSSSSTASPRRCPRRRASSSTTTTTPCRAARR